MYDLQDKEEFIFIKGSGIIDKGEAQAICRKITELLEIREDSNKVLLDLKKIDLKESQFDIFIQHLSKMNIDKLAIVLSGLINKFKFRLWSRRYKGYLKIEQFITTEQAKRWLNKE